VAVTAEPILAGTARGPVLRLDRPLSFWGGVDPATGRLTEPGAAQFGRLIARTVLMVPQTRGSSSSSAVMLELLRGGHAPAALVLGHIDAILGLGILVAREMGWPTIPLLVLPAAEQLQFAQDTGVIIAEDGTISREPT
jgi:predicted aconitase with swiveling domain